MPGWNVWVSELSGCCSYGPWRHTHTYIHKGSLRWSQKRRAQKREEKARESVCVCVGGGETERQRKERGGTERVCGGGGETEKREWGEGDRQTERERGRDRDRDSLVQMSRAQWQHTLHLCTSLDITTFSRHISGHHNVQPPHLWTSQRSAATSLDITTFSSHISGHHNVQPPHLWTSQRSAATSLDITTFSRHISGHHNVQPPDLCYAVCNRNTAIWKMLNTTQTHKHGVIVPVKSLLLSKRGMVQSHKQDHQICL